MKKLLITILSICLCCAFLFTGCSAPATRILLHSQKWNDVEELEYSVTSTKTQPADETFIPIGTGTLKTSLTKNQDNGNYTFKTDFSWTGKFASTKHQTQTFTDSIVTYCEFSPSSNLYLPISSWRISKVHNPKVKDNVVSLDELNFKITSDYSMKNRAESTLFAYNSETMEYDKPLTGVSERVEELPTNYTFKTNLNNFYDNEQMLLAIRTAQFSGFNGATINVLSVLDAKVKPTNVSKVTDETTDKATNLTPIANTIAPNGTAFNCYVFSLSFSSFQTGLPIKMYYENDLFKYGANQTKTYHNLLVKYIQGNLEYNLTKHNYTNPTV